MNIDEFWQLIDKTRIESKGNTKIQRQLLVDALVVMPLEAILEYDQIHWRLRRRADRSSLYDAAYVIKEGCSSDGFTYFRAWLIAQGKEIYEGAIKDPEILADYVSLDNRYETRAETINYVAVDAYELKTGSDDMPHIPTSPIEMNSDTDDGCAYTHLDELLDECIKRRYPKLWAKFGW